MALPTNGCMIRAASAGYGRPRIARQSASVKRGQDSRDVEAAIFGEAGQQHAGEVAHGRLPAGGDVAHGDEGTSRGPLPPTPLPQGEGDIYACVCPIIRGWDAASP